MNKREIVIFVNGILTRPGSAKNWTGKGVTWFHTKRMVFAEKVEYISGALFSRSWGQKRRAEKLRKTLEYYKGWDIHLVGHSNGSDVIFDCLKNMDWPEIKSITLFSPACSADFEKLGLNDPKAIRNIGKINVYIAGKDWALVLASSFVGKFFGYGSLGKEGPKNNSKKAYVAKFMNYGHSTWFEKEKFDHTMKLVVNGMYDL